MADRSQSALVSVYFTDVLPLRIYLAEARRVLKPGGIFIHVGPLIYHFNDESQMLTPDEVLAVFREYGFVIQTNEFTTSPSATTAGTMVSTAYINWVFTAICPPAPLTPDTVLALPAPLRYELHGQLAAAEEEEMPPVVLLRLPAGSTLEVSVLLLDLLRQLDGRRSLGQALALLAEDYELPTPARPMLFASLQQLLEMRALTLYVVSNRFL